MGYFDRLGQFWRRALRDWQRGRSSENEPENEPATEPSKDALSTAALRVLYPLHQEVFPSHIANGYQGQLDIDREQATIDRLRTWTTTLSDRRIAAAYTHWLDYFARNLEEAKAEMRTGKIRREMENCKSRDEAENAKSLSLAETLPKPPGHPHA